MNGVTEALRALAAVSNRCDGDYIANGLLHCNKCKTPKQSVMDIDLGDGVRATVVPIMCRCAEEAYNREEAAAEKKQFDLRIERMREDGISDKHYLLNRFDADDGADKDASRICRDYAKRFDLMAAVNAGMLLYGPVGTGKSFFACCIANELLDKGIAVCVTNLPRLLARKPDEIQRAIDGMSRYKLLVLDDLGAERSSEFVAEQVFNLIDSRYRSGKPMIVTTNLTVQDLQKAADMQYKRIYDRILEMCPVRMKIGGESRRTANTKDKQAEAIRILGL